MRWLINFYDFRFKWTATAGIGIHPTKAWLSRLVNFKNAIWTLEERYAIKFCFKLGKNTMRWKLNQLLWPRDQETEFPVEACFCFSCPTTELRKILTDNTTILEHQNNKQKLLILEALHIRNMQLTLNRINFQTSTNVLKCI